MATKKHYAQADKLPHIHTIRKFDQNNFPSVITNLSSCFRELDDLKRWTAHR